MPLSWPKSPFSGFQGLDGLVCCSVQHMMRPGNLTPPFAVMMSGTVFINRSNNKSAIASLQQAGEEMKRKRASSYLRPPCYRLRHADFTLDLPRRHTTQQPRARAFEIQEGRFLPCCSGYVSVFVPNTFAES